MIDNIALLRRLSLVSMLIAVISGSVSLILLFTQISNDKTLFIISIVALAIGFVIDRRIGKLIDSNVD
ncbi:MAG: hypothetical protein H7268_03300 [Sandarakinorhabdus sp.]|nr:hypothetical protein [Sandarakinorhabdus sp.]